MDLERLLDGAGSESQRANDTLQPGQQKARFFAGAGQIFPSATNFRGTAVVTSSSRSLRNARSTWSLSSALLCQMTATAVSAAAATNSPT